ncbi:MAG TPA: ABC transporter permease [Acidimicrobiia bacterium]|jgi:ABC-2 type transport system permease protein
MTGARVAVLGAVRSGPSYWFESLGAMLRWYLTSMRLLLPVFVVVQMLIASGFSVGISFFFEEITSEAALFLGTGASIIALILAGVVVAPQLIASEKDAGTYDFSWSLPVPRSANVTAWVMLNAVIGIPSMVVALVIADWRLDLDFSPSWTIAPAVVLALTCGTLIGSAVAHAIDRTSITQLISQVFAFGILGFTPITYPIENLPTWLESVHRVLPFYHMGVIVRGGLTDGPGEGIWASYGIVFGWTLAAAVATALVVGRRR